MFALPSLKAIVPAAVSGKARIAISLVAIDGAILAEASIELVVFALPRHEPVAVAADRGRSGVDGRALALRPAALGRAKAGAEGFVERGWQNWEEGNISQARSFFQYAAEIGLAAGAMGMGMTYDAAHLARRQAFGVVPDRNEALKWYTG